MQKIVIGENDAGQRLDRFLRKYLRGASLGAVYRIIRKDVKINGRRAKEDTRLEEGDVLTLYLSAEQADACLKPARPGRRTKKQFRVVYEDDQVLIVNKPGGLLVHGDAFEKSNTLANQVLGYLQEKGSYDPAAEKTFAPAPANRIDRNTSGLVIFGKTAAAARELARCIRERDSIRKFYLAIAAGRIDRELILTDRLTKDERENRVSAGGGDGLSAETRVRPLVAGTAFSLVEAELITGRTHQIRVHLSGAGHPLLGDPKYGDPGLNQVCRKYNVRGQLLHACRLEFGEMKEPLSALSGKKIQAPAPEAFEQIKKELIDVRE